MTTKQETEVAAEAIAAEIVKNAKPAPSVAQIMFKISALVNHAAKAAAQGHDRAEVFAAALRNIENTASQYWKHHHKAEARA